MRGKMFWRRFPISLIGSALVLFFLNSCDTPAGFVSGTRSADYVVEGGGTGEGKRWRDNRYYAKHVETESLETDTIHDPKNPAISALQQPRDALGAFPMDRRGGVDWVKAIELGIINPRANLEGDLEMLTMDMDILFKDTGNMPWVRFPHLAHTQWLHCSNCHPAIFIPQKGANNPSMDGILSGKHCGRCHDKVAFPLWICERCHSVPHENSPAAWW
ncbi:MAG: c(7)-type cytochrome triheme domain-containing protein [Thiohalomonadales bacterium]